MRFQSPYQHSEEQLKFLKKLYLRQDDRSRQEDFLLISAAASQGLPIFPEVYSCAKKKYPQKPVRMAMSSLALQWKAIRRIGCLQDNFDNEKLVSEMYSLDKAYFERGEIHPKKLLVVFTTMYNNFYVSNLVLLSMLQELGVSVLILKDASVFNYLRGTSDFGDDLEATAIRIQELQTAQEINEVYVTGFSSGGYASLFISSLINCSGYLGFSIRSDLSPQSTLHSGKFFTEDVRRKISPRWLTDLRKTLLEKDGGVSRKLFFGAGSNLDAGHAKHLIGVKGLSIYGIENCGHVTPAPLLIKNLFQEEFRRLIF